MGAFLKARTDAWLYVANLALLTSHQADAAYWYEWNVLGVPGGLPFFLLFNIAAVALLGTVLVCVAERAPSARGFAILCAGVGLFTCALHAIFLGIYRTALWTREAIGLLIRSLVSSIAQLLRLPKLDAIMTNIHARTWETAEEYGVPGNYVMGANIAGFVRVARAMLALGCI